MKKALALIAALLIVSPLMADQVVESSYTTTNDTALIMSQTSTNTICHVLVGVLVSSPTTGGLLKIYNSTWTTNTQIASISLNNALNVDFHNTVVKGIYYVLTGNSNGVTIIYRQ